MREKARRVLAWGWVGLCSLAIFLTVPVARTIQEFAFKHAGPHFFSYLLLAVVAAAFLGTAYVLFVRLRIRRPARYLWLAVCAAAYVYVTLKYWSGAVEAAHYLEYGVLGLLLFKAWRFSIPGEGVYPAALLTGILVGIADEIIQWIVPGRYFDFPDIWINTLGVGIVLVALRQGIRPPLASKRADARSVRRVSILFAVNLVLLGLCLSNTPERTAAMAARFTFLAPLEKEEPMHEFILRHRDPDIGVFYSRLTAEWLKKTDLIGARTNGQILRGWRERGYGEFLAQYNAVWTPFLYEMRIHIFRRDRYDAAGAAAEDGGSRDNAWFIAAKENVILERYFGRTLAESGYSWPAEKRRSMAAAVDLSLPYESPVSKGILPGLNEGLLWASIIGILALLASINLAMVRQRLTILSALTIISPKERAMKKIGLLGWICQLIVIIAGIDWGLIGVFKFDLVTKIFGVGDIVRIVFIVVGAAAVYLLIDLIFAKTKKA